MFTDPRELSIEELEAVVNSGPEHFLFSHPDFRRWQDECAREIESRNRA